MEISPKDVEVATNILKIIDINTVEYMFMGLSAITMLSAYEKRQALIAKHNGQELKVCVCEDNLYMYKSKVNEIIVEGLKKGLDFKFCVKKDAKGIDVTYIEVGGVQFSYHNGNTSKTLEYVQKHKIKQYADLELGRRFAFQNGAKEVFLYSLHLKNLSKLRYIDEKPLDYAKSVNKNLYGKKDNPETEK